jgi:hypothetical protein
VNKPQDIVVLCRYDTKCGDARKQERVNNRRRIAYEGRRGGGETVMKQAVRKALPGRVGYAD